MSKVFVVNKSPHDFSAAQKFGKLIYMSEGSINRYNVNHMARIFTEALKDSGPDDRMLLCGLNVMNAVACGAFAALHKRLNLLLFRRGEYIERTIVL